MDAHRKTIAKECLEGAYDDTMSFPQAVMALIEAGFEGYAVDYRLNTRTHYLPDGQTLVLENPHQAGQVAAEFRQHDIQAAIRWAQSNGPDYSYAAFNDRVLDAGCAGYIVSFAGKRVLYFGRTAEIHVEHFPQ